MVQVIPEPSLAASTSELRPVHAVGAVHQQQNLGRDIFLPIE